MQQLSLPVKCVTWIGWSNAGGSVTNESNASRFQRVDRGVPTVTQIHFKRLALGKLMDRRWLWREPMLCHYAGRVWSTMWTWWDRSPRFALVHMNVCVWWRGGVTRERDKDESLFSFQASSPSHSSLMTSNEAVIGSKAQTEKFESEIQKSEAVYNLKIWGNDIVIWQIGSLICPHSVQSATSHFKVTLKIK